MLIFANVTVKIYKGMTERSIRDIEEFASRLMARPAALQERIFTRLFEQAEIAKYTPEERQDYEDSLKVYRDMKNVLDTAELKGAIKEKRKNAKAMKALGLPLETIAKVTGMSIEDIAKL